MKESARTASRRQAHGVARATSCQRSTPVKALRLGMPNKQAAAMQRMAVVGLAPVRAGRQRERERVCALRLIIEKRGQFAVRWGGDVGSFADSWKQFAAVRLI